MKRQFKSILSDERIIELYWQRDETAITETDNKYRQYLLRVAHNILGDSLDAEECLSDTYVATWNAIPPAKPNTFKPFLSIIMRRIAINRYHHNMRKKTVPSEMTVALSELENTIINLNSAEDYDTKHIGAIIGDFIRSLSDRKQYIFMSRYYNADSIDAIAKDLRISRSTVNRELAAIKSALKEKLESEGYTI